MRHEPRGTHAAAATRADGLTAPGARQREPGVFHGTHTNRGDATLALAFTDAFVARPPVWEGIGNLGGDHQPVHIRHVGAQRLLERPELKPAGEKATRA